MFAMVISLARRFSAIALLRYHILYTFLLVTVWAILRRVVQISVPVPNLTESVYAMLHWYAPFVRARFPCLCAPITAVPFGTLWRARRLVMEYFGRQSLLTSQHGTVLSIACGSNGAIETLALDAAFPGIDVHTPCFQYIAMTQHTEYYVRGQ